MNLSIFRKKDTDMTKLYDKLISLFIRSQKELFIKNNETIPEIYNIGWGKSGSTSLMHGLDRTAAHWHVEFYFERIYGTKLLSENDISLFDLALYIGKRYGFKPLIIESYREPIARGISILNQQIMNKQKKANDVSEFIDCLNPDLFKKYVEPYSLKWKDYFKVDLIGEFDKKINYFYRELDDAKLLFLKLEDSGNWPDIFRKIGYRYRDERRNESSKRPFSELYKQALDSFRLSSDELDDIYDNDIIRAIYSEEEIGSFKARWKKDR